MSIYLRTIFIAMLLVFLVSNCSGTSLQTPTDTSTLSTTNPLTPISTPTPTQSFTPIPTKEATLRSTQELEPTRTPTATEKSYEFISNQYYVLDGDPVRKLSLFLPGEGHRKPQTLLIAGGQYFPNLVHYFIELGYPVISFNTRNETYLTEIQDGFCALAWAHVNAEVFGFDSHAIIPVGGSMWGGNAALLGLVDDPTPFLEECPNRIPDTNRVQAVVALAGVFDYSEENDFFSGFINSVSNFMGGTPDQVPENWQTASAITWVQGEEPPFLLVHGTDDTNVDPHQSEIFYAALDAVGTDVELVLLPGVDHYTSVTDPAVFATIQSFLAGFEDAWMQN